ncbi:MAG: 4Fe-4S binding protein [Chloroflexi bacterium]|nr:4Fe-4S binding protein [Chloroflexota bacterium]
MADLSVDLCGAPLSNPLVLASGPLGWCASSISAAFDAGFGAVVTKTIRRDVAVNPMPHIHSLGRGSLLNCEGWSDLPAECWIEQELPSLARRARGVLIASTGHTPAEVVELAGPLAAAGADLLELVSYRAEDVAPMVDAARSVASVPILVKVNAHWPDLIDVVGAALSAGASGVTAIDSIGPALAIDVETGCPALHSLGWLSGEGIRPVAVAAVARIALSYGVPIVATGGVARAEDVIEMTMAGATAVGVHTAPLLRGVDWVGRVLARLDVWLDSHQWNTLAAVKGAALPCLGEAPATRLSFSYDADRCTRCRSCVTCCAYGARTLSPSGGMAVCEALCRFCGLCTSVCPTGALTLA